MSGDDLSAWGVEILWDKVTRPRDRLLLARITAVYAEREGSERESFKRLMKIAAARGLLKVVPL